MGTNILQHMFVKPFLCLLASVPFLTCLVLPQTALRAQEHADAPPRWVVYTAYFEHVDFLESVANSLRAKGKDDKQARTQVRREAGLTEAEEVIVKDVALRTLRRQQAARDERTAVRKSYPTEAWVARTVPSEIAKKIKDLYLVEMSAPEEAVAELRQGLGAARFSLLDAYVNTRKSNMHYSVK